MLLLDQTGQFMGTRSVDILFIGNSLTQDGIAYLPYLLRNYYPDVKFNFYIWYNGGYTLAQHYQKFINDETCQIYSYAQNQPYWTNHNNRYTMKTLLENLKFDIVCIQEYFNYKNSYTESDLQDWNNVKNYILNNYTGDNALEFVSLLHAPLRSKADDVYSLTKEANQLILNKTIADDIIPVGSAVYRALSTSLDSLGDQGHLSPDGTHAQEGLPCLLQTFVAAQ